MKKIIIILSLIILIVLIIFAFFRIEKSVPVSETFIQCLADAGVVIYGSSTCPACSRLVEEFGGYDIIKPIYLDCSGLGLEGELERCREEMQTDFVPEIQIKGELFEKWGSPEALSEATGCQI